MNFHHVMGYYLMFCESFPVLPLEHGPQSRKILLYRKDKGIGSRPMLLGQLSKGELNQWTQNSAQLYRISSNSTERLVWVFWRHVQDGLDDN